MALSEHPSELDYGYFLRSRYGKASGSQAAIANVRKLRRPSSRQLRSHKDNKGAKISHQIEWVPKNQRDGAASRGRRRVKPQKRPEIMEGLTSRTLSPSRKSRGIGKSREEAMESTQTNPKPAKIAHIKAGSDGVKGNVQSDEERKIVEDFVKKVRGVASEAI